MLGKPIGKWSLPGQGRLAQDHTLRWKPNITPQHTTPPTLSLMINYEPARGNGELRWYDLADVGDSS